MANPQIEYKNGTFSRFSLKFSLYTFFLQRNGFLIGFILHPIFKEGYHVHRLL